MATASGQVTNAVFGFTSMLINLLRDQRPDGVVVRSTGRSRPSATSRAPSYKANREAAPDILRQQMGLVRQVVETLRDRRSSTLAGFEADDVIATLATAGRDDGRRRRHRHRRPRHATSWSRTRTSRCSTTGAACRDYALYDEAGIMERTGVDADAVPGVRRAARRPVRQPRPACPAWGRRPRPSSSTPTAASTASSPTSTSRRPSCARTSRRARGPACAATPR